MSSNSCRIINCTVGNVRKLQKEVKTIKKDYVKKPECDPLANSKICSQEFGELTDYRVRTEQHVVERNNHLTTAQYTVPTRSVIGEDIKQPTTINRTEEISASKLGKTDFSYNKAVAGSYETYNTNIKSFWKYKFVNKQVASKAKYGLLD